MNRYWKIGALLILLLGGLANTVHTPTSRQFDILKNIEIFTALYKEVNTYYVDDLDPGKLMRTGIDAMMGSLDPFTNYISESDIEGYRFLTEGRYHGIGAVSKKMGSYVTITELYQDQPADQAGLKVGDKIVEIDGKSALGRSTDQVNEILRGYPGSSVELTIERPGEKDRMKIRLVRGEVNVPNVPYSGMVSDDIGYIALTTFTRQAGQNVGNALNELKKENPALKGVIFDLRGNGGGLLSEAVNVSNVFIPRNELVASTRGKVKDWDRSFKTLNAPVDTDIPLVVLVNKNSASASEIVSGVIQDYDRGVLLGQRSYGKGLVQNTRDLGYNAKVKMTTAKYYIPSQRCIQSVEYEDGEPVNIPDAKRAVFKTRNGREVLDGGGISPDLYIKKPTEEGILKSLMKDHLIFDYVSNYCAENPEIAAVEDFHFEDFEGFLSFLENRNFEYESETEIMLQKLMVKSTTEGINLDDNIQAIQRQIEAAKRDELQTHRDEIVDLIEKEIASRYFYQRGKVQMGLRNDEEIQEAIELINAPDRYKEILSAN